MDDYGKRSVQTTAIVAASIVFGFGSLVYGITKGTIEHYKLVAVQQQTLEKNFNQCISNGGAWVTPGQCLR